MYKYALQLAVVVGISEFNIESRKSEELLLK